MDGKWIDRHDKFNVFISFEGENPLKKQKGKREKQRAQRIAGRGLRSVVDCWC